MCTDISTCRPSVYDFRLIFYLFLLFLLYSIKIIGGYLVLWLLSFLLLFDLDVLLFLLFLNIFLWLLRVLIFFIFSDTDIGIYYIFVGSLSRNVPSRIARHNYIIIDNQSTFCVVIGTRSYIFAPIINTYCSTLICTHHVSLGSGAGCGSHGVGPRLIVQLVMCIPVAKAWLIMLFLSGYEKIHIYQQQSFSGSCGSVSVLPWRPDWLQELAKVEIHPPHSFYAHSDSCLIIL